jgi:hypothetical protein
MELLKNHIWQKVILDCFGWAGRSQRRDKDRSLGAGEMMELLKNHIWQKVILDCF